MRGKKSRSRKCRIRETDFMSSVPTRTVSEVKNIEDIKYNIVYLTSGVAMGVLRVQTPPPFALFRQL